MKPKLVRDKICDIIKASGKTPISHVAVPEEYNSALLDKMIEELEEFRENPCLEEAADMYEVWLAILYRWSMAPKDVVSCANKKRKERGGFFEGHILSGVKNEGG